MTASERDRLRRLIDERKRASLRSQRGARTVGETRQPRGPYTGIPGSWMPQVNR